MNCKRMKDLILTDYIDGNLEGRALKDVERHLGSCPTCNALARDLKAAGKLLRATPQEEVPSGIWHNIRAEISTASAKLNFPETVLMYARYYLSHLRPVVVIASAAVLLLVILTAVRLMPHRDYLETLAAQDDILAISYIGDEENQPEYDLGTAAEMFFL